MMHERIVRMLDTEMRVLTDDDDLARALDYVLPHAEQRGPVAGRESFVVARHAQGLELRPERGASSLHAERAAVLAELSERLHRAALEPFRDAVRVHAALGSWRGRAFLLVGGKGAGKTTLLLRLLLDGCEAHGDELVLIRNGEALAFPRKFYVKQGTLAVVPELARLSERLPAVRDGKGSVIRAFEPGDAGRPWRIEPVRVAAIVALDAGFEAGESRIEPLPAYLAVERVLAQSSLPPDSTAEAVRDTCALVDGCRTWRLIVGRPEDASRVLRNVEILDNG